MLDAAVQVFAVHGFHGASMDEIAGRAGVSKPMVYAYLGSKEELFGACLRREADRLIQGVTAAAGDAERNGGRDGDSGDVRLNRGLCAFFRFVDAHRDGWAVLYRQARGQAPFGAELAQVRARMASGITVLLSSSLPAEGRRASESELEVMAYAVVGASESLADWLVDHPGEDPDRIARDLVVLLNMRSISA